MAEKFIRVRTAARAASYGAEKFTRLSQAPGGMPPMPGGMPPGGMPPMPGAAPGGAPDPTAMMAAGGPPGAPPPPPPAPQRQRIAGPLDSLSKILSDADINTVIENQIGTAPEDIATKIWTDYGGDPKGGPGGKRGVRTTQDAAEQPDQSAKEIDATENAKWMRLPQGKTISDITSLQSITAMMNGLILSALKKNATGAPGGGPPGGGGGGAPGGGGPPPGGPPPGGPPGGAPPGGPPPPAVAMRSTLIRVASPLTRVAAEGGQVDRIRRMMKTFPSSPDYGRRFWNEKKKTAWWVSGDCDGEETVQEIMDRLATIPGVKDVKAESECFPPGDGWEEVK
jgi:hypothetical protein